MLLEGKKAIITGGTRVSAMHRLSLYRGGRRRHGLWLASGDCDAAVEKLAAAYPEAKVWGRTCDLTSLEAVTEAFTEAAATWVAWTRSLTRRHLPALAASGVHGRRVRQGHGPQRRRRL